MMNLGKSILLENTGLLDEYTLYHMKYMTVDSSALFYYVLRLRMKTTLIITILATTYLGLAVCAGITFWYGLSAGGFLGAVILRYGIKGILLAFAGVLPQYLLYVPAYFMLLVWCENLNRSIYFKNSFATEEQRIISPKMVFHLVIIYGVILCGCLLESFMNPEILTGLLKIF